MEMASSFMGIKRKRSEPDLEPIASSYGVVDRPEAAQVEGNKKRCLSGYEYTLSGSLSGLIGADPNTNSNTYEQARRPRTYRWGTSRARLGQRKLQCLLPNPFTAMFGRECAAGPADESKFQGRVLLAPRGVDVDVDVDIDDMGEA
jgi:hypothetical protein